MQRAKLFAAAIALALSGAVYTAANMQESASQMQAAKKTTTAASCCAGHKAEGGHAAMSCDKDGKGCCAKHKEGGAQHASMNEGESCCAGGACCGGDSCCAGGSCDKHKKGEATIVKTSAEQGGESCCKDGASCCKDGAACCDAHKTVAQKASVEQKDGEGCCACCADHKQGGR